MIELKGGVCEGTYMVKRAPIYLRAVIDNEGKRDVLDLLEDTPKENESVHIYRLEGEAGVVHLNFGGGKGGWYALGNYHHMPNIEGEFLRSNNEWQKWALAQEE